MVAYLSVNSLAPEVTATCRVQPISLGRVKVRARVSDNRVEVRARVRVRFRVRISVSVSLNKNNSGAGKLTDKYQNYFLQADEKLSLTEGY